MPNLLFPHNPLIQQAILHSTDSQTLDKIDVISSPQIQKPSMYKVIMLNDDFTPMDFVVHILKSIFQKNHDEAITIMLEIHHNSMGICGIFTYEVAEIKQTQAMQSAKKHQYPLQCILEKE